jgi:hypothetical protein
MNFAHLPSLTGYPNGYLAGLAGLVLFWGVENFFVQAFLFDMPPITRYPRCYQTMRLGINLAVAAMFVLTFSQPALTVIAGVNFLLSATVLAHGIYFRRACSLVHGIKNFREGLQSWSFAFRLIPGVTWVVLLCALIIKICWIWWLARVPFQPSWMAVGLLLALLVAQLLVLQFTSFRFTSIRVTSMTRAVYAYGYLSSWLAEFVFAPDVRQRIQELRDLREISPDRLAGRENPWPVRHHVAVVQLESVGRNVLGHRIRGQEVTPFLNRLARASRVFELQAYHNIGTADMDYAALSGGTPSGNLISYFVPDIDYSAALPRFMREHGFRTVSLHGATGEFYNRRRNFERMGFDEILFREEFRGRPARHSYWGMRDQELFRLSGEKLRAARGPEFHFIITLDSHGPFDLITEEEKKIFPGSRIWQENYFNSLRVLDDNLRDYVEALPAGTLVILYGDHTAGVEYADFEPAREGNAEYVPCVVHCCGASGAWGGERSGSAPLPRDLRILDVLNFLRRQVEARNGATRKLTERADLAQPRKTPQFDPAF